MFFSHYHQYMEEQMINDLLLDNEVLVFGHRGFSEEAPENTMASFKLCRELGIPGVELDVHLCRSGELVVAHDFSLERTAKVPGTLEEKSLAELKELDFGSFKSERYSGERIITLDELFEEFGSTFIYDIELKSREAFSNSELTSKTWNTIRDHHLEERVLCSSFNPFTLWAFNKASGRVLPTGDIFAIDDNVPKIFQRGFGRHISHSSYLKPEQSQVTVKYIQKFKEQLGYPIVAWTVNTREQAERLIGLGVDGLIGNNPRLLVECVESYQI